MTFLGLRSSLKFKVEVAAAPAAAAGQVPCSSRRLFRLPVWNYELVNPEAMRAAPPVRYPHALPVSWALQTVCRQEKPGAGDETAQGLSRRFPSQRGVGVGELGGAGARQSGRPSELRRQRDRSAQFCEGLRQLTARRNRRTEDRRRG